MSTNAKRTAAEELLDSLLSEVGEDSSNDIEGIVKIEPDEEMIAKLQQKMGSGEDGESTDLGELDLGVANLRGEETLQGIVDLRKSEGANELDFHGLLKNKSDSANNIKENKDRKGYFEINENTFSAAEQSDYDATSVGMKHDFEGNHLESHPNNSAKKQASLDLGDFNFNADDGDLSIESGDASPLALQPLFPIQSEMQSDISLPPVPSFEKTQIGVDRTMVMPERPEPPSLFAKNEVVKEDAATVNVLNNALNVLNVPREGDRDKTIAVTSFQLKQEEGVEDKVKVSVGNQARSSGASSGFAAWGGSLDSHLGQAENLRMAQEKIISLENENERIRRQNEELISASEILKERSDLVTSQLTEYKNDREGLEQSFKNELTLLKNHLGRKDAELKKAQFKIEELESRLKSDLKKIRVRERELENRLELVRAEKNAISKNKDEQILDLRRKMDVLQMEVDSYRQKCVELNRQIESSQDSFKRTTRALRLAMANLELQEEKKDMKDSKVQLKKVD